MRRRILAAVVSVTTLAVLGFGVPLGFVVERFVEERSALELERAAVLASLEVSTDFATSGDPVELPVAADIAFGLYDANGILRAGTGPDQADALVRGALGNEIRDGEIDAVRVVAVPVAADERVLGVIRAARSTSDGDARILVLLSLLGALGAGVIVVSGALGWVLAGRLSRPVARLGDAATRLGEGDFAFEVPTSTIPEVDQVARALQVTAGRLDDQLARERAFSADASHQLRTPVAGIRAAVETELSFPRDDATEVLHEVLSDVDRLERTITELLSIARAGGIEAKPVELSDVLRDLERNWRARLAREGRTLAVASARYLPPVLANAAMLRHALDVLVDNALRHGGGTVTVAISTTGESAVIGVSDEGPGFAGTVEQALEPGEADSGDGPHGLGLALAQRLVEAMGARFRIAESGPGPRIEIVLRRPPAGTP